MCHLLFIIIRLISNKITSRYFRFHGLKTQVLLLPNGLIGNIFTTSLVHNDQGVLNLSGMGMKLLRLLRNHRLPDGHYPALFVDGIFTPHPCIVPRYLNPDARQERVNSRTASLRMHIEHLLGCHRNQFRFFRSLYRLKLLPRGEFCVKFIDMSYFVLNCYTCFNNSRSLPFDLPALTIEEYLPLN